MPTTPAPSFAAAIVPATCVPWPLSSRGSVGAGDEVEAALEDAGQLRVVVVDARVDDGHVNGRTVRQRLAARDRPHRRSIDGGHSIRRRLLTGRNRVGKGVALVIRLDRDDVARSLQRRDFVAGEVGREAVDAGQLAQVALVGRNARIEARRKRFDGEAGCSASSSR